MSTTNINELKGTLKTSKTSAELKKENDSDANQMKTEIPKPISDLSTLLKSMNPTCDNEKYYFAVIDQSALFGLAGYLQYIDGIFREDEGLTLIFYEQLRSSIEKTTNKPIAGPFAKITLTIDTESDAARLNADGLTSTVASALTKEGISANFIAAYYHDHIFVQYDRKDDAIRTIKQLSDDG